MKSSSNTFAQEKMTRFEGLCKEQGIPLTMQRRIILESLAVRVDHPTADQVFEGVADRLPGLSRTTVYRVLETLVSLGIIHKASHLGSAARYDPNTQRHHHLTCLTCHKVMDLEEGMEVRIPLPRSVGKNFEVVDYSIHFRGHCADCLKQKKVSKVPQHRVVEG